MVDAMSDQVTLRVFRFDPDCDEKPRYQEYTVPVEEELSALVLLNRIQQEIDPTLSFRSYCCGLQMCRSCLMRIDGKRRFACITLVKPGAALTVDPLTFPEGHIKDLVVEIADAEHKEDNYSHDDS
jgi:succinate dehydrogenase / fumarate reductase, iron-sulfur subunit